MPLLSIAQFSGFGLAAGGTGSTFANTQQSLIGTPNQTADQSNKFGGNGGIKLEWNLFGQDWIKLSPELYFQQKGSKEYYSDVQSLTNGLTDRSITLDYGGLLVPLKLDVPGVPVAGGDYGTLLYGQFNLYSDYSFTARTSDGNTVDFQNNRNRVDMGYSAYAGIAVAQGVFLQFGYHRGLKNIKFYTENSDTSQKNSSYLINNRNFSLSVVYILDNND